MISQKNNDNIASACYFFTQQQQQCPLPLLMTNYQVNIKNNFAKIQLQQQYFNPFQKSLEIHYAIPTDPQFSISGLRILYQDIEVIGTITQKEKAKYQYRQSVKKGETVMMGSYSKLQSSILKVKIGNIEAKEKVKIFLDLIGPLNIEAENQWTLRIPSHIGPRYTSFKQLLPQIFKEIVQQHENKLHFEGYANPQIKWNFCITLECSEKILTWACDTHKLKQNKISNRCYEFKLGSPELPETDLQFRYTRDKDQVPLITYGKNVMCLTFYPPEIPTKNKGKAFDFIFLLDRSGSMNGQSIQAAKQALLFYLKSLPENSKFNVISFGSTFEQMFDVSQPYLEQIVLQAISKISEFKADLGGTQIHQPLKKILEKNGKMEVGYQRHIILLTDGQVSNTQQVLKTIGAIKEKNIAFTHTIGVGSGFSMDLIKKGAQAGQGNYVIIINSSKMSKKIIGLLECVVKPKLTNFSIEYSKEIFDKNSKVPKLLSKGRPNNLFLEYNEKAGVIQEEFRNQCITIKYFDQQSKQETIQQIPLLFNNQFLELDKFHAKLQIQNLLQLSNNQENKQKVIQHSVNSQILCKYTSFICKIKECAHQTESQTSYYLKLKSALEGKGELYSKNSVGNIHVKTLTGKSVTFFTSMFITVYQLKQMLQQVEGIPADQQRMIFAGKQIENQRTLDDYGMQDQSTVHLVLRLRGDGGSSSTGISSGLKIFYLQIKINELLIKLREPDIQKTSTLLKILSCIYRQLPMAKNYKISLTSKNTKMDENKSLTDYPQITAGSRITVQGIPPIATDINQLIKLLRLNGSWQHSQKILHQLNLTGACEQKMLKYDDKDKAMTCTVGEYLKKNYPNKKEQLALIFKKINMFLKA